MVTGLFRIHQLSGYMPDDPRGARPGHGATRAGRGIGKAAVRLD